MLQPGTRIGGYEILAPLGVGGMGEVYRARDTRLDRDVALKILPDAFATDPDRLARFEREAKTLASLNHPHIAHIHGVEDAGNTRALVIELVEGEDLAQRVARGPIAIDEALPIAGQIAEALEAAHDAGIMHRDLKPANIKVRSDGTVKVLDFGLAKALAPNPSDGSGASQTFTSPAMTLQGVILGTAAYMSPEQARGKVTDRRTDIWAFGCVLFEMLAGKTAFDGGETVSDAIASILKNEPQWDALPPETPAVTRALLRRCLQKDLHKRLPHIGLARLEIAEQLSGISDASAKPPASTAAVSNIARWRTAAAWLALGAVLGVSVVLLAARYARPAAPLSAPTRLTVKLGDDVTLVVSMGGTTMGSAVVLSPDGSTLAFVGQRKSEPAQLYVRRLDQLVATPLSTTNGARGPFFSPDGKWIAFFADGKLKSIAISGGASVSLADAPDSRGGTWTEDDTIIFAPTPLVGLSRVPAAGGSVDHVTQLEPGEVTHRWPHALPGSKAILYEAHNERAGHDEGTIIVQPLPSGGRKVLHRGGYQPRYLPSGHLVYVNQGTLFAVPFDVGRLEVNGPAFPALQGVSANVTSGFAQFSASQSGTFAYVPSTASEGFSAPIDWIDANGVSGRLRATASNWGAPAFSPDGRYLALNIIENPGATSAPPTWVYDIARDGLTRLAEGPATRPAWTPDGKRITFSRSVGLGINIFWQPSDGSAAPQRLTESPRTQFATSWHPSGKFLALMENAGGPPDIHILPIDSSDPTRLTAGPPVPFATGTFAEGEPAFSPDGHWLAYSSLESGRFEVYVRPFPGPGGKYPVSTDGGNHPAWSRSRNELFYVTFQRQLMSVPFTVNNGEFRPEKPRLWTNVVLLPRFINAPPFALHPDGKRVVAAGQSAEAVPLPQDAVVLVFNFFDELRRIAPRAGS